MPQAIDSYAHFGTPGDGDGILNLAWTLDERACLGVDLEAVLERELRAEAGGGLEYLNRYFVQDPYGEAELGPALAAFFSLPAGSFSVTCGAGVIALLHGLARLATGETVHVVGDVYPDFPFWVQRSGGRCVHPEADRSGEAPSAPLVFLERPGLFGGPLARLDDLAALCDGVAAHGTVVVVDESNGNYAPPALSAARLVARLPNLVVLRGFSKAYGMGGLRLACCLASHALAERIRQAVPPLLASSFSLRLGRAILELGDVAGPLRERIRAHRARAETLLRSAGFTSVVSAGEYLPYLLFRDDPEEVRERLEARGIRGKPHPVWSGSGADAWYPYRLSAPLSAERMRTLEAKLAA